MAKVHNSPDPAAVGAEDERLLKALMIDSVGKIPLDVALSLSATPNIGMSLKPAASKSDGDLAKNAPISKYQEEISNAEDYKNAKFKILQYRQQKAERLERESKKKGDEKIQPRRRRRKSTGSTDKGRRKVDDDRPRKKIEDNVLVIDGEDLNSQDPHKNPKTKKIKHNTLSSYFQIPEEGKRQQRRSCRSVDTSSTTKTKKQSNSSGQKALSVNDLVNNSAWANYGKNSESFERRVRRTPRNSHMRDKMDGHHISSSATDGTTRKHFRKDRSDNDASALKRPGSAGKNKPRRKYRNNMSGSIDVISTNTATFPSSPITPGVVSPKPAKVTTEKTYVIEPELVTPYSVPPETKAKSAARSYSDRVMVAAASNRTPMASLKKYLKEEKMIFSTSENASVSKETRSLGRIPRKSKKLSNALLQIPFSDGASNGEINEVDNRTTALSVQSFGKSVAKSMRRQAKNTKRKIGRQISRITAANKSIDISTKSDSIIYNGMHDITVSPSIDLKPPSGLIEMQGSPDSPLVALKPPSRLNQDEYDEGNEHSPMSPIDALKPPSGHVPRKETGLHSLDLPFGHCPRNEANALLKIESDQKHGKQSGKNGKKKHRHKKKSSSKKKLMDESLEESEQGSSHSFEFYTSDNLISPPVQFTAYDDEPAEDSTIERSFNINPAIHPKLSEDTNSLTLDGDSTIDDGSKLMSPRYVSSADSLASIGHTPKPETSLASTMNSDSMSTSITALSSPSCTQSTIKSEKNVSSQNPLDNSQLAPNCSTIEEEDQSQEYNESNASERNPSNISGPPLHDSYASSDQHNGDDGLPQEEGFTQNENFELKGYDFRDKTAGTDLTSELYDFLKNNGKSKKESRARDRKEATRKAFEKHKRELERLKRNHEKFLEMNITVDHDPLAVSEISMPPHTIEQLKSPPKPRKKASRRASGSRSEEVQSLNNASKEKEYKSRRRGSKTQSRKKQESAIDESLISPVPEVEEQDKIAESIVNKSNSQILNLRMMFLQSNSSMQPTGKGLVQSTTTTTT